MKERYIYDGLEIVDNIDNEGRKLTLTARYPVTEALLRELAEGILVFSALSAAERLVEDEEDHT